MNFKTLALLTALPVLVPAAVYAAPGTTQKGVYRGMAYTAQSLIVGQTSTATVAGGGNAIYLAQAPKYRGAVGLLMDYGAGGRFVCSGSLSADRASIITAAHCVSDGATARPNSVTAFFYDGRASDPGVYGTPTPAGVTTVKIGGIAVNPKYTGEVIDQFDVAVLRLASAAPSFAIGYDLFTGDLTGLDVNVTGYGRRSDTGGVDGVTAPHGLGPGRLRQGDNRYDFRFGDGAFGGFFTDRDAKTGENFFGKAEVDFSYVTDFDNGLDANDASCLLATNGLGLKPTAQFCNVGRGKLEIGISGGDSGGGAFINGKLASVNSYGLIFSTDPELGDFGGGLNSGWGEFSGYAPINVNAGFINSIVPEPATWAMMIGGFGLVGGAARRMRATKALTA